MGGRKPFVVLDPNLIKKNKTANKLLREFRKINSEIFMEFGTNPTTDQVNNSVEKFRKYNPDIAIVIGGGSAIDLTKATVLTALNDGMIEDYLGGKKGNKPFLPFIAIPTTCGTGSEASLYAVIADPKLKKKRGIEDDNFLPELVLLDPQLIESLDTTTLAATAMDALAHVFESFVSSKANEITKGSARGILIGLIGNIEKATYTKNQKFLLAMQNVAFSSRLLYPRTGLTAAHALSHPLGAYTNIHHGSAVTFFIPETFRLNYEYNKEGFDEAFNLLGFRRDSDFYKWLTTFTEKTGVRNYITSFLSDMELPVSDIATDAMESSNIPSNPKKVSEKDLIEVVERSIHYWDLK